MAHETPTLAALPRDRTGTRYAKRLRSTGRLPAVIYGHKIAPVSVHVDEKEVLTLLHQGAHVLNVKTEDATAEMCLIKDLQFGYLGDNVIHIDFARVNLDEEVQVQIHLVFVGEPAAALKSGAILNHQMTELEVSCKVNAIPESIKVDLSNMETQFSVGEIELPPGVRTGIDPNTPVAAITFVHEEEAVGEEVEVGEGAEEPEVITEAKAEGEEEKKEGEKE
jgi:large subunit ribosomal protein L25